MFGLRGSTDVELPVLRLVVFTPVVDGGVGTEINQYQDVANSLDFVNPNIRIWFLERV